jgi:hypothetical protein
MVLKDGPGGVAMAIETSSQMSCASVDGLGWIVRILHTQTLRSRRNELHQSARAALAIVRVRIAAAFYEHYGSDEVWIDVIAASRSFDQVVIIIDGHHLPPLGA